MLSGHSSSSSCTVLLSVLPRSFFFLGLLFLAKGLSGFRLPFSQGCARFGFMPAGLQPLPLPAHTPTPPFSPCFLSFVSFFQACSVAVYARAVDPPSPPGAKKRAVRIHCVPSSATCVCVCQVLSLPQQLNSLLALAFPSARWGVSGQRRHPPPGCKLL